MPRNEPWWPSPAGYRYCCITCGLRAKSMTPFTIVEILRGRRPDGKVENPRSRPGTGFPTFPQARRLHDNHPLFGRCWTQHQMKRFTPSQQEIQRPPSGDCDDDTVPFLLGERRSDGSTHNYEPLRAPSSQQRADKECEWKQGKRTAPASDPKLMASRFQRRCL